MPEAEKTEVINVKMKYIIGGVLVAIIVGLFWLFSDKRQEKTTLKTASSFTNAVTSKVNQPEVGSKAPQFNVKTIDGLDLSLSNFHGKILVLTSAAAWCPTCVIESKNFAPVYDEIKKDGVEFITVDIDPIDDETAIREFQTHYAPWHNVEKKQAEQLIEDYGFTRFEITYIIDRDGTIKFRDSQITETETLREELEKLI